MIFTSCIQLASSRTRYVNWLSIEVFLNINLRLIPIKPYYKFVQRIILHDKFSIKLFQGFCFGHRRCVAVLTVPIPNQKRRLYRDLTPFIIIVTCTFVSIVAFGEATQSNSYLRVVAFGSFWCGHSVFFLGVEEYMHGCFWWGPSVLFLFIRWAVHGLIVVFGEAWMHLQSRALGEAVCFWLGKAIFVFVFMGAVTCKISLWWGTI